MKRSLIEINNLFIDVVMTEGHGDAIILLHCNSSSWRSFEFLFSSKLAEKYQIIAINLPGHSNSNLPIDFYLSIPSLADLIVEVVHAISPRRYLLVGHSVGGHIFSHSIQRMTDCNGLILISAPPVSMKTLSAAFKSDPCEGAIFTSELTSEKKELMAKALLGDIAGDKKAFNQLYESITGTDGHFRQKLGESLMQGKLLDEYEAIQSSKTPTSLMWGGQDSFIQPDFCAGITFNNPLGLGAYLFKNAGHSPHLSNSLMFEKILGDLAEKSMS